MRELIARSRELVLPGGHVLVELGADQASRARALAGEFRLEVALHTDLAGIERVLELQV